MPNLQMLSRKRGDGSSVLTLEASIAAKVVKAGPPTDAQPSREAWDWNGRSTSWNRCCCMELIRAEYVAAGVCFSEAMERVVRTDRVARGRNRHIACTKYFLYGLRPTHSSSSRDQGLKVRHMSCWPNRRVDEATYRGHTCERVRKRIARGQSEDMR